jgi:probable addiction module antidote protein
MGIKTVPHDAADFLTDDETISAYLTEALESDEPKYIAKALGAVARAHGGMAKLAVDTGIAREALYRALSDAGNPELGTVLKVLHALGVQLSASVSPGKSVPGRPSLS